MVTDGLVMVGAVIVVVEDALWVGGISDVGTVGGLVAERVVVGRVVCDGIEDDGGRTVTVGFDRVGIKDRGVAD